MVLRALGWVIALSVLVWLLVDQIELVGNFRVDDAYISYSFAKNLGSGHGLVFSHGLRVEGYSNFLWVVLVGLGYAVHSMADPYVWARILTFAFLAAAALFTYLQARRFASPWASLLAVGLLLGGTDAVTAALSGLETVPYMAAVCFGWWVYLSEDPRARRWSLWAFLPAALMRIDGFLWLLVVGGFEVASSVVGRRFSLVRLLRWAAAPILVWVAYFCWRYWYYGLLLPSTYYAKTLVNLGDPDRSYRQIWDFLREYGALGLLPLMTVPLLRGPRRDALALWLAVLAQLSYVAMVGGDWMPFNRFFLPIVPLAFILSAWGVQQVWREAGHWPPELRYLLRIAALAAVGFAGLNENARSIDTPPEASKRGTAEQVKVHTLDNLLDSKDLMARVIRHPGDKLVTDYAGVFGVFTDAEVIDQWGLCNADIALHGGTRGINPIYGKECASCYARIQPDYFHVTIPLVRSLRAFGSKAQVLNAVFQGPAIDRVIDIRHNFVVGRVVDEASNRALWFLERRRSGESFEIRRPEPGIRIDYPFLTH